jgi:hypothetical protein
MPMSVARLPHWFTVPALSDETGVSEWLLRKEIKAGNLRARRLGRVVRVLDEDAAEWMRGRDIAHEWNAP